MPDGKDLPIRLRAVLHVLYLIFNEGYAASSGETVARQDLSAEAIRLARLLHRNLPAEPEAAGLLALMLLTDARRPARTGTYGVLVSLAEQDRTLWSRELIAEGVVLIETALAQRKAGFFQIQAAIAAIHDEAASTQDTDWPQILALYELLVRISANPLVALNRAIATAMVNGPRAGLAQLDRLDAQLATTHRLTAVRAHLLEMAGDYKAALDHYRAAANLTSSEAERRYLNARAAALRDTG